MQYDFREHAQSKEKHLGDASDDDHPPVCGNARWLDEPPSDAREAAWHEPKATPVFRLLLTSFPEPAS
jgi:hypothetical protein